MFLPNIIEKGLNAWELSCELSLPAKFLFGYKVAVGYEKPKTYYVFAEFNENFVHLSEAIHENWIFLKVCASAEEVQSSISVK